MGLSPSWSKINDQRTSEKEKRPAYFEKIEGRKFRFFSVSRNDQMVYPHSPTSRDGRRQTTSHKKRKQMHAVAVSSAAGQRHGTTTITTRTSSSWSTLRRRRREAQGHHVSIKENRHTRSHCIVAIPFRILFPGRRYAQIEARRLELKREEQWQITPLHFCFIFVSVVIFTDNKTKSFPLYTFGNNGVQWTCPIQVNRYYLREIGMVATALSTTVVKDLPLSY